VSEHPPAHTPLPAFRREVPHSLRRARGHDGRRPPPKAPAHASCGRSRRTHRQEMRSDHASDASCRMVACDVRVHDVRTHDVHTRDVRTRFRPVSPPQSNATVTTPSSLSLSVCVCVCVSSHLVSSRVALSLARSLVGERTTARRGAHSQAPHAPATGWRPSSPPIIASDHRLRSSPPIIASDHLAPPAPLLRTAQLRTRHPCPRCPRETLTTRTHAHAPHMRRDGRRDARRRWARLTPAGGVWEICGRSAGDLREVQRSRMPCRGRATPRGVALAVRELAY